MILFVGDKSTGYWIEEPAKMNGQKVEYIPAAMDVKSQTNQILRLRDEKVEYVIYDLEQYSVNSTEIADEILHIYKSQNAEPIFLSTSFLPSSDLILKLQRRGFHKFIFAYSDTEKKSELEKCMNGYYDSVRPDTLLDIPAESESTGDKIKIGVSGACSRIGITTQATQLVKHLLYCGERACYIELNSSHWLELLADTYTPDFHDPEKGKITFSHVDMFYRQDLIPDVLHMDYHYYVYDFGSYDQKDFNKISFLEKDMLIMMCGSKPGELQRSSDIINSIFYQKINYIFNFTAPGDRKEILDMMEEKAAETYFMDYIPDMFVYSPAEYYSKLFPNVTAKEENTGKKKRKWWWKNG